MKWLRFPFEWEVNRITREVRINEQSKANEFFRRHHKAATPQNLVDDLQLLFRR
jgi:hypothetical protein